MTRISRRGFFGAVAGLAASTAVGIPLISGASGSSSTGTLLPSGARLPEPFTVPFALPPVLAPTRRTADTDYYRVVQRPGHASILPGLTTPIWGYNGIFPGPTIRARSGRAVVVHQTNQLPVPVVVHLHGASTPHGDDGYPTDLIMPPGWQMPAPTAMMPDDPLASMTTGTRDYRYPLRQRATTLWYHDHRMGFTGASVWRGLAGFFLIGDDEEDALPLPRGDRDWPLMIADRSFNADGSFSYPSVDPSLQLTPGVQNDYSAGVLGDVILVNGHPWPQAQVTGARYRLRVLNASNARRYRLRLDPPPPDGSGLVQIGSDGGLLAAPVRHDAIEIAPAQRFDLLVDFSQYRPGQKVVLHNDFGDATTQSVMQFVVGERAPDNSSVPDRLSTVDALLPARAARQRTLNFRNVGGQLGWQINGRPFDPSYSSAVVPGGDVEVWRLVTDFHHPIHLHLVQFQVLSRGLNGPGPYDHGWKDVIDLRPAEEAAIIARFVGDPGRYVFHCHNLEHEDMAMMGNFTVA